MKWICILLILFTTSAVAQETGPSGHLPMTPFPGWDATANNPPLGQGWDVPDDTFIVNVAGATVLSGITSWAVNDVAVYVQHKGGQPYWIKLAASIPPPLICVDTLDFALPCNSQYLMIGGLL
jgi:hypothetical protein